MIYRIAKISDTNIKIIVEKLKNQADKFLLPFNIDFIY
jgi:hypothetical protein